MASPEAPDPDHELTAQPVKLSKHHKKSGCMTTFAFKVLKHIRAIDDTNDRRTQRADFLSLFSALRDSDEDGKEVAYRPAAALELESWLNDKQRQWDVDVRIDFDYLLSSLQRQAAENNKRVEAEKTKAEQVQQSEDDEWLMVANDLMEWDML